MQKLVNAIHPSSQFVMEDNKPAIEPMCMPAEQFYRNYSVGNKIGSGGFGKVYECARHRDNAKTAAKIINKEKMSQNSWHKLVSQILYL
jgi:serine/threonine protein kinase